MHGERPLPSQRAEHRGVMHLARQDIERLELTLELRRVVNVRQQVGDGNQLAILQQPADEARVVVTPLLAVRDHVHACADLGGDGETQ